MKSTHAPAYQRLLQRLRAARAEAGMTQADAAKALKRTQSFVSKCEAGERRIDAVELKAFATVYGTSVSALLDE